MKCAHLFCAGLLTALLVAPAAADESKDKKKDENSKAKPAADREERHRQALKEFDKDGDGKLNEDERAKARDAHRARLGERGRERGDRPRPPRDGRRPDGPGPEGRRGPGPGGPPLPDPGKLFDEFDANDDDQLSREEFEKLTRHIRERMASRMGERRFGPGGPPEGRRPGPSPEGRRPDGDRPRLRGERPEGESPRRRDADRPRRNDSDREKAEDESPKEDADKATP